VIEAGRHARSPRPLHDLASEAAARVHLTAVADGRYEDFWAVTVSALCYAIGRLGLEASEAQRRRLMDAYLSLRCFPEVREAVARLASRPRALLSNGSPKLLPAPIATSGLGAAFKHVLSVDALLCVSSNAWDVAGAKAFGFGAPEEAPELPADLGVTGLDHLPL